MFRETTPQSPLAHPRDALTAAWALLDYGLESKDEDAVDRAKLFGEWFVSRGIEKGYPYWTARFDDEPWEPLWCGSFHSGSAFFMYRLFLETGGAQYRDAMCNILDFYNRHHLSDDGTIGVILDRDTLEVIDNAVDEKQANPGWVMMHRYNDDFGTLANLAAWKVTGKSQYLDAAVCFLSFAISEQNSDGGFGAGQESVPSAGGAVAIELISAMRLGVDLKSAESALENAVQYILDMQNLEKHSNAYGGFYGMSIQYEDSKEYLTCRTGAYSILALLKYAGSNDGIYSIMEERAVQ